MQDDIFSTLLGWWLEISWQSSNCLQEGRTRQDRKGEVDTCPGTSWGMRTASCMAVPMCSLSLQWRSRGPPRTFPSLVWLPALTLALWFPPTPVREQSHAQLSSEKDSSGQQGSARYLWTGERRSLSVYTNLSDFPLQCSVLGHTLCFCLGNTCMKKWFFQLKAADGRFLLPNKCRQTWLCEVQTRATRLSCCLTPSCGRLDTNLSEFSSFPSFLFCPYSTHHIGVRTLLYIQFLCAFVCNLETLDPSLDFPMCSFLIPQNSHRWITRLPTPECLCSQLVPFSLSPRKNQLKNTWSSIVHTEAPMLRIMTTAG